MRITYRAIVKQAFDRMEGCSEMSFRTYMFMDILDSLEDGYKERGYTVVHDIPNDRAIVEEYLNRLT